MTTVVLTKRLYRLPEARELLSLSKSQMYRELNSGRLRSVGAGQARRIRAEDVDAYLNLLAEEAGVSA